MERYDDPYHVSNTYGNYLGPNDEDPYNILMRMKSWNNEIASTISKVNDTIGGIHEQQSQILQTIDTIKLEILDIETVNDNQRTQIAQLQLTTGQITLTVADIDTRVGHAEAQIVVQAGQITQRVTYQDYNGSTVTSMIVQDPYSINLLAQQLNLYGMVTFTDLQTQGKTIINGSNIITGQILANLIYGSTFVVGNGTSSTMTLTSILGSHSIRSNDANGFSVSSSGSLSLSAGNGIAIFTKGAPLVILRDFRVQASEFGSAWIQTNTGTSTLQVSGTITANTIWQGGGLVANQLWVLDVLSKYTTNAHLETRLAQKEAELVQWANGRFALK